MNRPSTAWQRLQETPLEIAVCVLAALVSAITIGHDWSHMSWLLIALTATLGLGGAIGAAGRFADRPDVESSGLALLLAALLFVAIQEARSARDFVTMSSLILNYGALIIGFGIRLRVARQATRARRGAARILAERNDPS